MTAPSGSEDDDPMAEARAYNSSIYLMAGTPYFLLGCLGLLFYWKARTGGGRPAAPLEDDVPPPDEAMPPPAGDA